MACLSIDDELKDNETIRMDQTLRTAIGIEPVLQGLNKSELIYDKDGNSDLVYPINVQRAKFNRPNLLTRSLKQQYLICNVHHAMATDMEIPIVRLSERIMEVLGIKAGDRVRLINGKYHENLRCLPLDPKYQLPLKTMESDFADWKYQLPENEDLRLPWITLDRQARLALDIQPWQPIIVGRDTLHALSSEYAEIALAIALGALGGAIVFDALLAQVIFGIVAFAAISLLIWAKIRSKI
jgi:hypothetical protein